MEIYTCNIAVDYIVTGILNSKPELNYLTNKIATTIPDKWEEVGYELGIRRRDMQRIKCEACRATNLTLTAYREIFGYWLDHELEQCTWTTVLNALASEQVGEERLARSIRQDLLQRTCN